MFILFTFIFSFVKYSIISSISNSFVKILFDLALDFSNFFLNIFGFLNISHQMIVHLLDLFVILCEVVFDCLDPAIGFIIMSLTLILLADLQNQNAVDIFQANVFLQTWEKKHYKINEFVSLIVQLSLGFVLNDLFSLHDILV